jgi:hypothetical protein
MRIPFGGSTGVARVTCGSLGALRRRLSAGLPLSRASGALESCAANMGNPESACKHYWTPSVRSCNLKATPNRERTIVRTTILALVCLPAIAIAQTAPVSDAFKDFAKKESQNLIAAADEFPADKYSYKPTDKQMTVGDIVAHLVSGNEYLCGAIGGQKAPDRATKLKGGESKDQLMGALKESFAFCDKTLASLDDSKLGEQLPFFGGKTQTRAAVMTITTGDWADHYSQMANYLRLNNMLPPTAQKKPAA